MRSEKDRKRSNAASVARGRMYLNSDLAWLPGYPVETGDGSVDWQAVPRGGNRDCESLNLTREHLRRGVDPAPWTDPPEPRQLKGNNGRLVHLSFESDPLEIFRMGGHFQTCLSPGDFNFFSVFANAADINKHVVCARDAKGRVVGRCLLALCEEGRLLTFEPYCHDARLGFAEMITDLAGELASRMGTVVVSNGRVPCLVATTWYDDGPRDLTGRFAFLAPKSAFRRALASITPDSFLASAKAAFQPLPLDARTLPPLIELPELRQRPELLLPLLPAIRKCSGLTDQTWIRIARLAYHAGAVAFSHRILRTRAVPHLLRLHRRFEQTDDETLAVLVELEPSMALQVLRRTRTRGVRSDDQEWDPIRRDRLAKAHDALGRPTRAQRLRSLAHRRA